MVAAMSNDGADAAQVGPDTMLVRAQDVLVRLTNEDEVGIDIGGERHLATTTSCRIP